MQPVAPLRATSGTFATSSASASSASGPYSAASAPSASASTFGAFGMSSACRPLLLFGEQPQQVSALAPTCSHLTCVQCSHRVVCLPQRRWTNADYFFFRNAMPDEMALMRKTVVDPTASAYCCQCAWMTVVGTVNITQSQAFGRKPYRQEGEATPEQVKWVCSKYS